MYRRFSAHPSRLSRPDRGPRGGFTLVELLVVITIIAMLVGLLIPAVNAARNASRKTQCLNNQKQLGTGILQYATTKEKFPPLFSGQPPIPPPPAIPLDVGWVPSILPFIEQNPMYTQFQNNTLHLQPNGQIDTLICPSRDPDGSPAPLSYVVNGGATDSVVKSVPMDYQENAVFFDQWSPKYRSPANQRPLPTQPIDVAYVSTHDGTKSTIMLTENMDALDWYIFTPSPSVTAPPRVQNANGNAWWNAVVWYQPNTTADWGTASAAPVPLPQQVFNQPANPALKTNYTPASDATLGRPFSNHSGGFFVTYCDGRTEFMSETIDYRVYCLLMAPDSNSAKYTLSNVGTTVQYPSQGVTSWYVNGVGSPLKSLTDADTNK